jgi:hypothetical protein
MSYASLLNANRNIDKTAMDSFDVSAVKTVTNGTQSYTQLVDSEGKFHLQNDANPSTKLLSFNSNGTLADSRVKAYTDAVQNTVSAHATQLSSNATTLATHANNIATHNTTLAGHLSEINRIKGTVQTMGQTVSNDNATITQHANTLTDHDTRITTLETTVADLNDGALDGITSISVETASIGGVLLSNVNGDLSVDGIATLALRPSTIYGDSGPYRFGKFEDEYMLSIFNYDNIIRSDSNATLEGFSTITNLQNRCLALENYVDQLKVLLLSISRSLDLKHPTTLEDFDYTNLL